MKTFAALLLISLATSAASAQPVYRCGNTYSGTPCVGGAALADASDTRSVAQRVEARRVAADERRLAAEMQRDRLADEQQAARTRAGAVSLSGLAPVSVVPAVDSRRKGSRKKRSTARSEASTTAVVLVPGVVKRRGSPD
jgi:hypothetical protein